MTCNLIHFRVEFLWLEIFSNNNKMFRFAGFGFDINTLRVRQQYFFLMTAFSSFFFGTFHSINVYKRCVTASYHQKRLKPFKIKLFFILVEKYNEIRINVIKESFQFISLQNSGAKI